MNYICYALRVAKQYYTKDNFEHAIRVAVNVAENELIPESEIEDCITLAIMHDLLEDTEYKLENVFTSNFDKCLELLTKPKEQNYIEYIKNIRKNASIYKNAYWVKLADMKDHFAQTETLTEKLRDKYLAALPYLL